MNIDMVEYIQKIQSLFDHVENGIIKYQELSMLNENTARVIHNDATLTALHTMRENMKILFGEVLNGGEEDEGASKS